MLAGVLCLCVEVMGHHWTRVSLSPELIPSARLSCLRAQRTLRSPELEPLRSAPRLAAFPGGLAPEAPGIPPAVPALVPGGWALYLCSSGVPAVSTLIFTSRPVAPTGADRDLVMISRSPRWGPWSPMHKIGNPNYFPGHRAWLWEMKPWWLGRSGRSLSSPQGQQSLALLSPVCASGCGSCQQS